MNYVSTRGGVAPVDFAQAVMMGLGTDGGLLVPQTIPQVDAATLAAWARLPFADLALEVMAPFVGDCVPREDLAGLIRRSYATFSHPEVTPVVDVGGTRILELFHGPTAAFKDVALQFLGNLFEYLLERDGGRLNIVGATSGDTGSAAIAGVRGKARIEIFILHPQGRVSPIQERQMTTVLDANVHNVAVRGTFDDAQSIVKALFNDLAFKDRYHLGAVNSINWARILAQTVYYFFAWGRVSGGDPARRVSFAVPTGNFGDVFAGYIAKRMGLPVDASDHRHQPQRHPDPLRPQRGLCRRRGPPDPVPGHGHPDRLQLRALPLLPARRATRRRCATCWPQMAQHRAHGHPRGPARGSWRRTSTPPPWTTPRPWSRSARPSPPPATSSTPTPPWG